MATRFNLRSLSKRGKRRLILIGAVILVAWLAVFDSHSLVKRWRWHREVSTLRIENEALKAEIDRLQAELDRGLTDEEVERIAREQYGMRKKGETVYREIPDKN